MPGQASATSSPGDRFTAGGAERWEAPRLRTAAGPRATAGRKWGLGSRAPQPWLRLEGRGHARAMLGAEATSLWSAGKYPLGACGGDPAA